MRKIAVCGYTSSVGNRFCNNTKFQIVKIGRRNADVYLDLLDGKATGNLNILKDCDILINFAALSECDSDAEKNNMIKVNVNGPLFLAELANEYNIPYIIHISSISATYRETDNFYGYYSITKKTGEDLLKLYCKQKQIGLCILEPTAMYGDQSFAKHQKLLYNIINQVRNNETVTLYGENDARRNYLNVDILCRVIEKAIWVLTLIFFTLLYIIFAIVGRSGSALGGVILLTPVVLILILLYKNLFIRNANKAKNEIAKNCVDSFK